MDESWMVIIYCFLIHSVADGIALSFGIVGTQLIERRNYSRELVAWLPTILYSCFKLSTFFTSSLYRRYGCKLPVILGGIFSCLGFVTPGLSHQEVAFVYVFIGIVFGISFGLMYVPTWVIANTYYRKKRQLANGLVMSGSAVGVVIFSPFVEWLLAEYGLQGTFLILGGVGLNIVVIGALIPPLESSESEQLLSQDQQDSTNEGKALLTDIGSDDNHSRNMVNVSRCQSLIATDLLKNNWKFTVFIVASCLVDPITLHTFYTYVPDYIIHMGYSSDMSWQPITISGVTNTLARCITGFRNKSGRTITLLYSISATMVGLSLLFFVFPLSDYYWLLCVNGAVYGFGKGLYWSLIGPVLAEIVPVEDFDRALGTEQFFTGFFMLACPIQGKLYDITGEYTWTFVTSGTMATVGGCFLWVLVANLQTNI